MEPELGYSLSVACGVAGREWSLGVGYLVRSYVCGDRAPWGGGFDWKRKYLLEKEVPTGNEY